MGLFKVGVKVMQSWLLREAIIPTMEIKIKKFNLQFILAWENSWHFAMPLPISHEMTYEERQKKLNTVDPDLGNAFDWKKQMFNQSEALPLSGKWSVIWLEFLWPF